MNKNSVKKQLLNAQKLKQQGNLAAAKSACTSLLEVAKTNHEALNLLGEIELQLGNPDKARDLFTEAAKLNGKEARYQINLAVCLLRSNCFDNAETTLQKALQLAPQNTLAQKAMGELFCRKAAESDSQSDYRSAEKYLRTTLNKIPKDVGVLANLSHTLQKLNKHQEALKYGLKALNLAPSHEDANHIIGNIHSELGDFEKALSHYRKILRQNPRNTLAFRNFTSVKKFTADDPDLELVRGQEALLKKGVFDEQSRRSLFFALGKVYDDIGEWDRAFRYFELGNRLANAQFDRHALAKKLYMIRDTFSKITYEVPTQTSENEIAEPIFIIGMPRSGSSLVEQIITKHSKLTGLGEYQGIYDVINSLNKDSNSSNSYLEKIASLDETQKAELRNIYLKEHQEKGKILVDKMLSNYENIGLITLLFPNAKIIHCERNPFDVCLSSYMQDFVSHAAHTYNLSDLSYFYKQYQEMMEFWNDRQPASIFNIPYEQLVDDLPGFSKKMIEFCGVEWEEACLEFYSNSRSVQTSSKWQVRQPVYKSSLNRWKNYEGHLASLIKELNSTSEDEAPEQSAQTSMMSKLNPFRLFG